MTEGITRGAIKVIEVIGVSDTSWEDAAKQAVAKAAETIDGITGVEVLRWTARHLGGPNRPIQRRRQARLRGEIARRLRRRARGRW